MDKRQSKANKPQQDDTADASWLNVFFAIWMIISPYALALTHYPRAVWNNIICGIALGLFALIRISMPQQKEWSWINMATGVWIVISPFVLGFMSTIALWNNVILGIAIAFVAWAHARTESETA